MAQPTTSHVSRLRRVLRWLLAIVLVLLLAAGATAGWWLYQHRGDPVPDGTPARPGPVSVHPSISPVPSDAPQPTARGVAAALRGPLRDRALGTLTGQVSDPLTGKILWKQKAGDARTPASNAKILTASAALLALPHDARITTRVVLDSDGTAVIVGAGDPTLTSIDRADGSFYSDPARIADLADQIKRSGRTVTGVAVDDSAFDGPDMQKRWDRRDIEGGDIAPLSALMVDGARVKPTEEYSPRSTESAKDAGRALADALGVHATVTERKAPGGADEIAAVQSAPLTVRVGDMMRFSDNVLAEFLAMEISTAQGGPMSIEAGTEAVLSTLRKNSFDVSDVTLVDSSGLSYDDKVPAATLDEVMAAAAGDGHPLMRSLLDSLPVARGTGTLADRFDPEATAGAGWVRAKTGTLTGVSSLTGIVQTVDGRVLSFALMSGGTSPADARPALDALAGALRDCGCRS
ncbi:D-alanyl-D-alanine carboxypeptidase/D-alanyl-D-alanine endopeptidase [Gordonia shandongensis]|uniref:D-alanyl-D-alanine carboxypeptidase/D-alanyl-D-alanine endopeptidase n=1 Tax=Gordonia shandongensis TaxID=376351 RepID=UPI000421C89A|nr:D-alanyl-D-alanine carboxypeptidase/D-alanyl-D-alanine-endopeptidase [Gordonia shandongensis]